MGYNPAAEAHDTISPIPEVTRRLDRWKEARKNAQDMIRKAQERWIKGQEQKRKYAIGDQIWLEGKNIQTDQPTAKLAPKRHGPFKIAKVLSPVTYQVTLPPTWKIHNVFHIDLLTPYHETEIHGPNYSRPPPDLISGEEEYEIERILDMRQHG